MYEDNRRFSWTSLFIKIIIVVIFILFTIWLLSLSMKSTTKGMSNSLNVLTDNIFKENIDRMKDVGKDYFTTERLPEKVGEIKTLTLEEMYKKNLILEVKDKNGKACSAKNSYVSVEKLETEYQMKVYLECGSEKDFIKVIMGCYNYCNTDICERKDTKEITNQAIEYQYSKTTGGAWGPWGAWTDWSNVEVSKNNYRDVETKVVNEQYSYDKEIKDRKYTGESACIQMDGYTLIGDENGQCTYTTNVNVKEDPVCPSVSGYSLISRDGFSCTYKQNTPSKTNPVCSTLDGYSNPTRDGFNCTYNKPGTAKEDPACPSVSGYSLTSRDGFSCTYKQNTPSKTNPVCPTLDGYSNPSRSGFTCTYSKQGTTYANPICPTVSDFENTGIDNFTCNYMKSYKVAVGTRIVSSCNGCAKEVITVYETRYEYTTKVAICPEGYTRSGDTCAATTTLTETRTATCPEGYTKSGSDCVKYGTVTKSAKCPEGYTKSGSNCVKETTLTETRTATCPSGYSKLGNSCVKYDKVTKSATCPNGYTKSGNECITSAVKKVTKAGVCATGEEMLNGKCYKVQTSTVKVVGYRDVTYYRYRVRSYTGGITDYKWSSSNNDRSLLDAGYRLTGKTRNKEVGGK